MNLIPYVQDALDADLVGVDFDAEKVLVSAVWGNVEASVVIRYSAGKGAATPAGIKSAVDLAITKLKRHAPQETPGTQSAP